MLPCRYTSCQGNYCSRRVERASSRCEGCESVIENLWRPSPFPQPPSSPAARERKGGIILPHLPLGLLSLPHGEKKGGMSVAVAILRLSTIPRSRITPLPQRGRGRGDYTPSPSPRSPFSPSRGKERGDERSSSDFAAVNDTAFTHHPAPAARERGRG